MSRKEKAQVTWQTVIVLAVIFISIIIVQVKSESSKTTPRIETMDSGFIEVTPQIETIDSDSSEATSRIDTIDSGFLEVTPRIEASLISGNGESFISVGGKLLREGDIINGFRFLKVYPDKVEFEKNGKIVVGTINTQTSTRPKSNDLLQRQVSSEQARYKDTYYKQYRQPTYTKPSVAENESYYGQISENTGRPKTVYARGYYRKDGTYVRSHYRSPPRR